MDLKFSFLAHRLLCSTLLPMMTISSKKIARSTLLAVSLALVTTAVYAHKESADDDAPIEELKAVTESIAGSTPVIDDVKAIPGEPAEEITDKLKDETAVGGEATSDAERERACDTLAGSPDPQDFDPTPYYTQGLTALKAKRYQDALDCFNHALKIDPNFYKASFQKAVVFQVTGYPDQAIRRYEQLVKYHPEMAEAHINLGSLYRDRDKIRAEAEFRKAIDIYYYSLPAHYNLANLLLDMGRYEEAMKEYKACLKFNRKTAFIHNNMGVIYQKKKYYEEAAQEFSIALRLSPQNKIFQDNLRAARKHIAGATVPGTH